ncbi:UNVERIFIED_CONTAM: Exonuclease V, chloroplastic [Sesamum calycinum]|uniref:Exonuclease V, chloroplastic n=1 Tax=Sesamum calycinum TaxID=2727403 RepID=A0AAW2SCA6_9LAMI
MRFFRCTISIWCKYEKGSPVDPLTWNNFPSPSEVVVPTVTSPELAATASVHIMTHSPTDSCSDDKTSKIPVEIIAEEEMALIEAALAAAVPYAQFPQNSRSIRSITLLSKRRLSACTSTGSPDIEDSGRVVGSNSPQKNKKIRGLESFLHRFRRGRGLSVTDITATEWCEKQMEFILLVGKPGKTKAMQAGSARHAALEGEVIKRVKVHVQSAEDMWALKFINFIVGANQLLFDGLTRELPLVGFVEGVWMVGIIDEIRMPKSEPKRLPILVDTKTRVRATLPSEPQRRNGRIKLKQKLSDTKHNANLQITYAVVPTLNDVVRYYGNSCSLLPQAHDKLLLRYELQEDQSLLGEDEFAYEPKWVKDQVKSCLEFWLGEREASYPPMDERWKCRSCKFASTCAANSNPDGSSSKTKNEDILSPETPS